MVLLANNRTFPLVDGKKIVAYYKERDGSVIKYTKRLGKADMFLSAMSACQFAFEELPCPEEHVVVAVEKKLFGWKERAER